MSVYYKFKSAVKYDTVTFDGQHISVKDLKEAIMLQKRIGRNNDVDLKIMDAQTKSVYTDMDFLIPKNSSILIARVPVTPRKTKQWESQREECLSLPKVGENDPIGKSANLSSLDIPEEEKIRIMMSQSTQDYDPSKYKKLRGFNQVGRLPPNYRCHKCHQEGHWIKDCTFADGKGVKKSTGIPRSFMVKVEGPQVPGARIIDDGQYAVPLVDYEAYNQRVVPATVNEPKLGIPDILVENNKLYLEKLENNEGNHSEHIGLHPVQGLTTSPPEVSDVIVNTKADNGESKKFSSSIECEPATSSTNLDSIGCSPGDILATPALVEPTAMCDSAVPISSDFSDRMTVKATIGEPSGHYGYIPSILEQAIPSAYQSLPPAMGELSTFQDPPPYYGLTFPWYTPDIAPEPSSMPLLNGIISSYPPIGHRHYGGTVGDRTSTRNGSRRYHREDEYVTSRKEKRHAGSPFSRRIPFPQNRELHTYSGSMSTSVSSRKRVRHFRSPSPRMSPPHKEHRVRDVVPPQHSQRSSRRENECLNNQRYDRSGTLSYSERETHFRSPSSKVSSARKGSNGDSQNSLRFSKKEIDCLEEQRNGSSRTVFHRKRKRNVRSPSPRVSPSYEKRRRQDDNFPRDSSSKRTSHQRHRTRDNSSSSRV